MNLKVKIGKLSLATPLVCASGTFGYGNELTCFSNHKNIGAVITKTITLDSRAGNLPPRIYETDLGVLNSVGLENPGLQGFIREKLPQLKKIKTESIVSVGGFSQNEYEKIIERLDQEKEVKAFEVNLSCPNIRMKKIISQDKKLTSCLVKALRRRTDKTLIIKITPEVNDIAEIAKTIEDQGADSVSLVNTFFGMAINIQTQKPALGSIFGGYSGKAIKPMALYRVWRVAQRVKIPIIGGGGIETANDAIEFILAGASAVSLGTINMVYPNAASTVLDGIKKYLKQNKINDIKKLRGKLKLHGG